MPPRKMGFSAMLLFWKLFSCCAQSVFIAQIEHLINFCPNSFIPSKKGISIYLSVCLSVHQLAVFISFIAKTFMYILYLILPTEYLAKLALYTQSFRHRRRRWEVWGGGCSPPEFGQMGNFWPQEVIFGHSC